MAIAVLRRNRCQWQSCGPSRRTAFFREWLVSAARDLGDLRLGWFPVVRCRRKECLGRPKNGRSTIRQLTETLRLQSRARSRQATNAVSDKSDGIRAFDAEFKDVHCQYDPHYSLQKKPPHHIQLLLAVFKFVLASEQVGCLQSRQTIELFFVPVSQSIPRYRTERPLAPLLAVHTWH